MMAGSPFRPPEVQVDRQNSGSWSEVLAQFSDANIYQSWAYGAVRWGDRHLSHLVLRRGSQILAAAQLRIARLPVVPAGIAYLRWGPLCHRVGQTLAPSTVAEMLTRLREEYCTRRGLTLQVIPNAWLESDDGRAAVYQPALTQSGLRPETHSHKHRTVLVDLGLPLETMRKRLDQKWRNQLNRAEKNGLVLETGDSAGAYLEFVRLYEVMWERKRFETSVDVTEFGRIQELLSGPARMQTFLARSDGRPVAALVCSLMGDTAIYLLGATDERARELKAAYFLQWQAMVWLKDRGARWYDLGGIDPETNPGGYHFKSGFGGCEVTRLPCHAASGGALSDVVIRSLGWLRRRRNPSPAVSLAA